MSLAGHNRRICAFGDMNYAATTPAIGHSFRNGGHSDRARRGEQICKNGEHDTKDWYRPGKFRTMVGVNIRVIR